MMLVLFALAHQGILHATAHREKPLRLIDPREVLEEDFDDQFL